MRLGQLESVVAAFELKPAAHMLLGWNRQATVPVIAPAFAHVDRHRPSFVCEATQRAVFQALPGPSGIAKSQSEGSHGAYVTNLAKKVNSEAARCRKGVHFSPKAPKSVTGQGLTY